MSSYVSLHNHSTYSTLDALSQPWQIAKRAREIGSKAIALTDHSSLSGIPAFMAACKEACKHCGYQKHHHLNSGKGACAVKGVVCPGYESDPIKPILGCELYLCPLDAEIKDDTNGKHSHLCVLAKNLAGWKSLMKLVSKSNRPEYFYKKPRLNLDKLKEFSGNLIAFSGHPGSDLANVLFRDITQAYNSKTVEQAKSWLKPWKQLKQDMFDMANKYLEIFGKENFFVEIQLIDKDNFPAAQVIANALRWLAKELGLNCIATGDAHYATKADAVDQRVLLCAFLDKTLPEMEKKVPQYDTGGLTCFFRSNNYHIPSYEEMVANHTAEEIENTNKIADMIESFDIFAKPKLPQFDCPNNLSPAEYMAQLCEIGWKQKILSKIPVDKHDEYRQRLEMESEVLNKAGLAPYFLIVNDICKYAQEKLGCKKSRGRGSAAGCLVSYLLDITDTDPIKYALSFERFYNDARNDVASGKVSLPDIDMDFPISKRELVIEYIRLKYGINRVAQMVTYSRLQGRGAVTEVLKAHDWSTFEERKTVTKYIPDESDIADDLQEMLEESGEASIIMWALEHMKDKLAPWVELQEDGTLTGILAKYFEQAIRIEGTKKSQGKHPAGIIIAPVDLEDECLMLYDKSTNMQVAGFEMSWLEKMGFVKFDILGVAILDKIQGAAKTAATGIVGDEDDEDFGDYKG